MVRIECDAVLFDLDGVLVDSVRCSNRHWLTWAQQKSINLEEIKKVANGRRTVETISLVAPHLDAEKEAELISIAEANDTEGVLEVEYATKLVQSIPENAWAVVTSGSRAIAMARIKCTGLKVPQVLVAADDVKRGKPDPAPYLLGAQKLKVKAGSCTVIEDAPNGIEAALDAGMWVIAVCSTHSREELSRATVVIDDISELRIVPNTNLTSRLCVCIDEKQTGSENL